MSLNIVLLRAVNVGGHARIAMADLVALFERIGLVRPRSLLHAGSFVLGSELEGDALEAVVEREIETAFGLRADAIVRSAGQWASALEANPFGDEAREAPTKLHVMSLKTGPAAGAFEALMGGHKGPERAALRGRHIYIVYPEGAGSSKFTGSLIERKLGVRGTARNWNTALKLKAVADAEGSQAEA